MRFHTLRTEQQIDRPLDEVFAFFSNAHNLEAITPAWVGFKILTPGNIELAAGATIRYRIKVHGIPLKWTTVIRRWEPPHLFVDVQTSGPYRMWHHTHRFEGYNRGTRMTDTVRYVLPLGCLGRIVQALQVKADLKRIFQYRSERIAEIFAAKT